MRRFWRIPTEQELRDHLGRQPTPLEVSVYITSPTCLAVAWTALAVMFIALAVMFIAAVVVPVWF